MTKRVAAAGLTGAQYAAALTPHLQGIKEEYESIRYNIPWLEGYEMTVEQFKRLVKWCRANGVTSFSIGGASASLAAPDATIGAPPERPQQEASAEADDAFERSIAAMDEQAKQKARAERLLYWSA